MCSTGTPKQRLPVARSLLRSGAGCVRSGSGKSLAQVEPVRGGGFGLITSRAPLGAPAPPGPIRRARAVTLRVFRLHCALLCL